MVAVLEPQQDVEALIEREPDLSVAAYNGASTVVSGPTDRVEALLETCSAQDLRCTRLDTSHAFHSAMMEPIVSAFGDFARSRQYERPQIPLVSNLTGEVTDRDLDADYWAEHIREPVRFARGIEALVALGGQVVLELGPRPTLVEMGQRCLSDETRMAWIGSLRQGREDVRQILGAAAQLHVRGVGLDLRALNCSVPDEAEHVTPES